MGAFYILLQFYDSMYTHALYTTTFGFFHNITPGGLSKFDIVDYISHHHCLCIEFQNR